MVLTKKEIARRKALGAKRRKVRHFIRCEMAGSGWTMSRLAEALGCTVGNISKVVAGECHSMLVLNGLREIGVPERYLFDPRKGLHDV